MSFTPSFGRWEDQASVDRVFGAMRDPFIRQAAPNLFTADDNADVDLCQLYEAATGRKWNSRDQNPRGFCVGFGNAKTASLSIAMMAHAGEITDPGADVAIEPVYGGMRYEIGKIQEGSSLYRGDDGGVGAWAVDWLLKYGVLLMKQYGSIDFTSYSEQRCDQYGSRGVPDELEPIAKEHPLQKAALCQSGDDVWALIGQLHPVVHCSNQGFAMNRDSNGVSRPQGSWAHCAGWNGRFTLKGRKYVRYDNSWGGYLGGPMTVQGDNGPINLNADQFLVELGTVDRMCRDGRETYAFTGPLGFTSRRPLGLA